MKAKGDIMKILLILLFVLMELQAKVVFVSDSGNDANTGLGYIKGTNSLTTTAILHPWFATSSTNSNRAAANDTVALCGDESDNIFTIATPCTVGFAALPTVSTPVFIKGYTNDGLIRDGVGKTGITTTSAINSIFYYALTTFNCGYVFFEDLTINGGGSGKANYGFITSAENNHSFTFKRCRITNASIDGAKLQCIYSSECGSTFFACEIDHNGKSGTGKGINFLSNSFNGVRNLFYNSIHDNATGGVFTGIGYSNIVLGNIIYSNGGDGYNSGYGGEYFFVFSNNICFKNTGTGLTTTALTAYTAFTNNIFRSNTTYGVYTTNSSIKVFRASANNDFSNNGTNPIDINGNLCPGLGNIYTDPLFNNETAGSENFNLQATSPCKNTGIGPSGY